MLLILVQPIRVGHSLVDACRPYILARILLMEFLKVLPLLHPGKKLRNVYIKAGWGIRGESKRTGSRAALASR